MSLRSPGVGYYPEWLGRDLLAGSLPWEQAVPASLATFLERHSLHESFWIGLYAEPERSATLLLESAIGGRVEECPILAIRFDALERSEVKLRDRGLESAVSGPINRAADTHRTHLVGRHGGDATLVHSPGARILCLGRDREVLPALVPAETV
ncbi:MAG TPA: hypothetical protein VMN37_08460 [Gemmatimonadales bacterium]|nr:hypothetical protein [Gemmatimonadales bacterium]